MSRIAAVEAHILLLAKLEFHFGDLWSRGTLVLSLAVSFSKRVLAGIGPFHLVLVLLGRSSSCSRVLNDGRGSRGVLGGVLLLRAISVNVVAIGTSVLSGNEIVVQLMEVPNNSVVVGSRQIDVCDRQLVELSTDLVPQNADFHFVLPDVDASLGLQAVKFSDELGEGLVALLEFVVLSSGALLTVSILVTAVKVLPNTLHHDVLAHLLGVV